MKKSIEELLVAVNERIKFVGQSKNHMEIRGINDFCPAFIYPDFLKNSLTVRTVAVTAGIIVYFRVSAAGTLA